MSELPPLGDHDRPSRHGAALGKAMSAIADAGAPLVGGLPPRCVSCAFSRGTMPNACASTVLDALRIVTRQDSDRFACHHGQDENGPTRICAGYLAAMAAPFDAVRTELELLKPEMASWGDDLIDPVRADFDAWRISVDPDKCLDTYSLARLYAKRAEPSDA